jgi:hypothetical protein
MENQRRRIPKIALQTKPQLPRDVRYNILLNTKRLEDIVKQCTVDKQYASICNDDGFWRKKYQLDFGELPLNENNTQWRILYGNRYRLIAASGDTLIASAISGNLEVFRRELDKRKAQDETMIKTDGALTPLQQLSFFQIVAESKNLDMVQLALQYLEFRNTLEINRNIEIYNQQLSGENAKDLPIYLEKMAAELGDQNIRRTKISDYIRYLAISSGSSIEVIDFLIHYIDDLIQQYEKDYPTNDPVKDYNLDYLANSTTEYNNIDITKFLIRHGYTDWMKLANGSLGKDSIETLKYLYSVRRYTLDDSNKLLYNAGIADARKCINFLLLIKGINVSNLLYGAVVGGHFNLVEYLISNTKLTKDELTGTINKLSGSYSQTGSHILNLLISKGGDPTTFANSSTSIEYKRELAIWLTPYNLLYSIVTDFNYDYPSYTNSLKNITVDQLNDIFRYYLNSHDFKRDDIDYNSKIALPNYRKLISILDLLLKLDPDLYAWLALSIRSNNESVVYKILLTNPLLTTEQFNELIREAFSEEKEELDDITRIIIEDLVTSSPPTLDYIFEYLSDVISDDYGDFRWFIALSLAHKLGRNDLITNLKLNPNSY